MRLKSLLSLILFGLCICRARAYGPLGHETVGAIADERLAGTLTGTNVSKLLDGMSLAQAANIPDEIKGWDRKGPEDAGAFHIPEYPRIEKLLVDFWTANKATDNNQEDKPSHHWFHYTDVPILGDEKYADGAAGRSKWDIVHMMVYCIRVLQGDESEQNARGITKPVAVILLAHYMGDLHQPLHVGAEYFDRSGHPDNPDKDPNALGDQGGNTLFLMLHDNAPGGHPAGHTTLHGYWDSRTVATAYDQIKAEITGAQPGHPAVVEKKEIIDWLAKNEPKNWKLGDDVDVKQWPEQWANEILPLAKQAYEKLRFADVVPKEERGETLAAGFAKEPESDNGSYGPWAGGVVRIELQKAGWRLVALLEKALQPAK